MVDVSVLLVKLWLFLWHTLSLESRCVVVFKLQSVMRARLLIL